jgi:gamma-glutamyltranspeptidase/glutathione hydrolase
VGLREPTTSVNAGERDGNIVCITQSLGSIYGSDVVNPGTGVCMNNFPNWGDLEPASPDALRHLADPTAGAFLLAGL